MNQRQLAAQHEARKSKPEAHECSYAARHHLFPVFTEGGWLWTLRSRGYPEVSWPITFCPWCGVRLPDRGRLKVEEVSE